MKLHPRLTLTTTLTGAAAYAEGHGVLLRGLIMSVLIFTATYLLLQELATRQDSMMKK
jgi:hypothetical protein